MKDRATGFSKLDFNSVFLNDKESMGCVNTKMDRIEISEIIIKQLAYFWNYCSRNNDDSK